MRRKLSVGVLALVALMSAWTVPATAMAKGRAKVVRYRGFSVAVPATWPVYDLRSDPAVCVRFDRHAVYLGQPSSEQRCPAHAVGRTEAILLEPLAAQGARSGGGAWPVLPSVDRPRAQRGLGSSVQLAIPARGIEVTATWSDDPEIVARALGRRLFGGAGAASRAATPPIADLARAGTAAAASGAVYTGLGFDPCSAPSESHMAAWGSSPYRAIGVYLGGTNMACGQSNLTAAWVADESAAGWHLVPTYVGFQAPNNSCGCAAIIPAQAPAEGAAAAADAVAHAEALGIGPGNPIYYDMEGYTVGGTNSQAVLAFLSSWTSQLHADGYISGAYGGAASGISDLAGATGTGIAEPDDIWFAHWNNAQTTSDPYIPSTDWSNHQRLHQYDGGHNETYGGVTINIDGDYIDGATAAAGSSTPIVSVPHAPTSTAAPAISGTAEIGHTLWATRGVWSGTPATSYDYFWQVCAPVCTDIPGAASRAYRPTAAVLGADVRVVVIAANAVGAGHAGSSETGPISPGSPGNGYWLFTAYGNVYNSSGAIWYGSPSRGRVHTPSVVGMAGTMDAKGYWVVTSSGSVYQYGDAPVLPAIRPSHPVVGIVAAPGGGYWLFTAYGNVYNSSGAVWYGSASRGHGHVHTPSIVGMAATADGKGYWLVDSSGIIYRYGDAPGLPAIRHSHPIVGIVPSPRGGYWLYTAYGNVYNSSGAGWYGSPSRGRVHTPSIVGMTATADGQGYWLVDSSGNVYRYGDARGLPAIGHTHPMKGIAG